MNDSHSSSTTPAAPNRDEMLSALFANMVVQHSNMALIFLGQAPHPDTGEHILDLETARMFIDQLEMLAVKTRGNLTKQEETLLKQGLTATRMAFVQGVEQAAKSPQTGPARPPETSSFAPAETPPAATSAPGQPAPEPSPGPEPEAESRKKFTKKY